MTGLALMVVGCRGMAPQRGILGGGIHSREDVAVNTEQARLRMRALVEPLCGTIVTSADRIIAGTTNRSIRRAALVWKIEAVPAVRESLFSANPFFAAADTWALMFPMGDYFEQGPGKQALGEAASIAATTCQHLEHELMNVAVSFTRSGNVTNVRNFVRQWAAAHPIKDSIAGRTSTLSFFTDRKLQETFSTPEVVGSVVVTMDDVTRRIDVYSAQLLEQSRWQAELFALDLAADYRLDQAMPLAEKAVQSAAVAAEAANRLVSPLEKAVAVVEDTPEIAAKERAAAFIALHDEITRVIQFGQQERIATLQNLTTEREAALSELHRNVTEELNAVAKDMTQNLSQISLTVVDHSFVRTAQLAAAILVAFFAGCVLLLLLARRWFTGNRVAG